ncbi:MAG: ferrous iron transport protein A [Acholeplasmatales bacterium]|jgi:ferrous iron transport protein A|nr:ferrous iron transport protein A [Acholeplasmatales bacterium]MBQ4357415.1 ferrous iron transport protein A [Acholeplasmatales bacterium]
MPLVIAPLNVELAILRIAVDEKDKKHFESLGIAVNQRITVLSNTNGNVILKIKEGRLALDRNIATKIFVSVAA